MKLSFRNSSRRLALSLMPSACSTPSAESLAQNDPWEKTNRDVFDFDVQLDHAVARPSPNSIAPPCRSRRATASTMP